MRGRPRNKGPNPLTRTYESNGPDVKIRGTAQHVADKYAQLARDAQASGDPVSAENYFQHAEHYYRMIAAAQEQFRQQYGITQKAFDEEGGEDGDDDGMGGGMGGGYPGGAGEDFGDGPPYAPQNGYGGGEPPRADRNGPPPRFDRNDRQNRPQQQRFDRNERFDRNGGQDRSPQDRGPPDRGQHDRGPQDRGPQDRGPQDRGGERFDRPPQQDRYDRPAGERPAGYDRPNGERYDRQDRRDRFPPRDGGPPREAAAPREARPEREPRFDREARPEREPRAEREPRPEREARPERQAAPFRADPRYAPADEDREVPAAAALPAFLTTPVRTPPVAAVAAPSLPDAMPDAAGADETGIRPRRRRTRKVEAGEGLALETPSGDNE